MLYNKVIQLYIYTYFASFVQSKTLAMCLYIEIWVVVAVVRRDFLARERVYIALILHLFKYFVVAFANCFH